MSTDRSNGLVEAFLARLSGNTARAYRADLSDLQRWLSACGTSISEITETQLLRYLRQLALGGRSEATLRRRLTCLRGLNAFARDHTEATLRVQLDLVAQQLRQDRQIHQPDNTSLLIVSDDVIVREGLLVAARTQSLVDVAAMSENEVVHARLPRFDYALVHIWPTPDALDQLTAMRAVSAISRRGLAQTVIALNGFVASQVATLRLVEAGCSFMYPYTAVSPDPGRLLASLKVGSPLEHGQLPTQWALREALGLRWNGEVEGFLAEVEALPRNVWTTSRPISDYDVDRAVFRQVQRAARDLAGLPEPQFSRYASSTRKPPDLPEWPRVRAFVRGLWGYPPV